jgi:hypothetical protein
MVDIRLMLEETLDTRDTSEFGWPTSLIWEINKRGLPQPSNSLQLIKALCTGWQKFGNKQAKEM